MKKTTTNRWLGVLLMTTALGACGTIDDLPEVTPPDRITAAPPHLQERTYSNGLTLRIAPSVGKQLRYVHVAFQVGARDDPAGASGLAYLAQHILRHATYKRDGRTTGPLDVAPVVNAWTTIDETHFEFAGVDLDVEGVLAFIAAQVNVDCTALAGAYETERRHIQREIAWQERDQDARVKEIIQEVIYPDGHPYRRKIYGVESELGAISPDDTCAFIRRHFVASSATVAVTGNVRTEEVDAAARRQLAPLPRRLTPPREPPPPSRLGQPELVLRQAPVVEPRLVIVTPSPSGVLGEMYESALGFAAQRVLGEASAEAQFTNNLWRFIQRTSTGTISAEFEYRAFDAKRKDPLKMMHRLIMRRLRMKERSGSEFDRDAEMHLRSAIEETFWSLIDRVEDPRMLARFLVRREPIKSLHDLPYAVRSLTTKQVRDASHDLVTSRQVRGILLLPDGSIKGEEWHDIRDRSLREHAQPANTSVGDLTDYAPIHDPTTPGYRPRSIKLEAEDYTDTILENGLRLVVINMPGVSRAYVSLVVRGGVDDDAENLANAALGGYRWEVPDHEKHLKEKNPDLVGISSINWSAFPHHGRLTVDGSGAYIDLTMGTLARHHQFGEYGAHDAALLKDLLDLVSRDTIGAPTKHCLHSALVGESRERLVSVCRWDQAKREESTLHRRDIERFRDVYHRPNGATLVIVGGGLNKEQLVDYANTYFGGQRWTGEAPPLSLETPAVSSRRPRRIACVKEENGKVTSIAMSLLFPIDQLYGPDHGRLLLIESMLASELDPTRRSEGIFRNLTVDLADGLPPYLLVHALVERESATSALPDIEASIEALKGDGQLVNRINRAQRLVRLTYDQLIEDPGMLTNFITGTALPHGLGVNYAGEVLRQIDEVTVDQMDKMLRRITDPARSILIVRGTAAVLREIPACAQGGLAVVTLPPEQFTSRELARRNREYARNQKRVDAAEKRASRQPRRSRRGRASKTPSNAVASGKTEGSTTHR